MNIELTKEQLIIGALILDHDNKAIEIITGKIFPSDFKSKKDAIIYEAILQFKNQKIPFDIITIADYLRKNSDEITLAYLGLIAKDTPSPEYVLEKYFNEEYLLLNNKYSKNTKLKSLLSEAMSAIKTKYLEDSEVYPKLINLETFDSCLVENIIIEHFDKWLLVRHLDDPDLMLVYSLMLCKKKYQGDVVIELHSFREKRGFKFPVFEVTTSSGKTYTQTSESLLRADF
jgi:hypothetical protein